MTPDTSVDEDDEEERILNLLKEQYKKDDSRNKELQEGLKEFEGMSHGSKLKKLDELVKRSQLFSSIIADTLLESSLKAKPAPAESVMPATPAAAAAPPAKKRKLKQASITDMLHRSKPSKEIQQKKQAIADASNGQPSFGQPKMVTGCTMKDYQIAGMEWLITLYQNGLNGILADEMGLGKTLQSIAMLAFLYEQGITGPFLICCPLSTVSNWTDEFHRFAPDFNVISYVGPKDKRAKLRRQFKNANVVVTSYEISIRDFKYLANRDWKYLIVDEGHRLKNADCLLIQMLKKIRTSNRLLLTGTPLQNNLDELWSLLNFILPEIFHDIEMFQQWFDFSAFENLKGSSEKFNELISIEIQKALVTNLHTILRPFLLRRLKRDVIKDLPPKKEYTIYSKLSDKQAQLYKAILGKNAPDLLYKESMKDYLRINHLGRFSDDVVDAYVNSQLHDDFPEKNPKLDEHWQFVNRQVGAKKMQNVMMQLRLCCDSPYLFFFPWNDTTKLTRELVDNSSKLQILDQLLPSLLKQNHKVLIFSQFTGMLDILEEYLTELQGVECCRIDGSTNQEDRQQQIEDFNTEGSTTGVFLLSTRAGGLGVNLTAADTVVLFDSDWNPQVDLQAMDRVHRIGQTKPVVIYRLVCASTIEEFLLAKADSKRSLERLVIQLGDFHTLLQRDDPSSFKKKTSKNSDEILDNLEKFLGSKEIKTKHINDNKLSKKELTTIQDRSPDSYKQVDDDKNSHISLFETVTPLE